MNEAVLDHSPQEAKTGSVDKPVGNNAKKQIDPAIKEAHALFIKAKVYNIVALCLAAAGFFLCVVLHQKITDGNVMVFIEKPMTIFVILLPFVPAAVLQFIANSKRKKCLKLVEKKKLDLQSFE